MNQNSWTRICVIGFIFVTGCGKSSGPKNDRDKEASVDLKLFGVGYRMFQNNESRPPQKLEDLMTVISSDRPIDFKRYQFVWGVDVSTLTERTIIVYDVEVPEKGGMVLYHDGTVERVTAEEFQTLPKATPAKPMMERSADVTFTPTEYIAEFNKLGLGMGRQYQNKVIELKGIIKGIGSLSGNLELLVISLGKEQEEVRCFLTGGGENCTRIAKGQQVTVKGFVRDPQGNPMLTACEFTTSGPSLAVKMSAEELAKELAADSKASEKYKDKSFIMTGEIISIEKSFGIHVKLKGTENNPVMCWFYSGDSTQERDKKLVPGAKIKFYGEYGYNRLDKCELIPE